VHYRDGFWLRVTLGHTDQSSPRSNSAVPLPPWDLGSPTEFQSTFLKRMFTRSVVTL